MALFTVCLLRDRSPYTTRVEARSAHEAARALEATIGAKALACAVFEGAHVPVEGVVARSSLAEAPYTVVGRGLGGRPFCRHAVASSAGVAVDLACHPDEAVVAVFAGRLFCRGP